MHYESRFGMEESQLVVGDVCKRLWDGRPADGMRLLVHTEQGFGDTFQFVRFVPMLRNSLGKDSTLLLLCQPSLAPLLKTVPGIDEVHGIGTGGEIPFDRQIPLLSLPHRLGVRLNTIPASGPYLQVPKGTDIDFEPDRDAALNVGFVWSVKDGHITERLRTCPLAEFAHLFDLANVHFHSLQFGNTADDITPYLERDNVASLTDQIGPFENLLAAMERVDLIISVDTASVHLAGAAGKPVWALIHHASEWR